jgi:hypothetical protein
MKNIITILFVFICVFGFSQTKNDTIDFNNVNYGLLNDLIFQKHNEERLKIGRQVRIEDNICKSASQYQVGYMSQYSEVCHDNDKVFNGVILHTPLDRFNYFSKGSKLGQTYHGEICYNFFSGKTHKITYEQLAQQTITAFMESTSHKAIMLSRLTCLSKQYGYFSTTSTLKNGYFNFFVTGFFTYRME